MVSLAESGRDCYPVLLCRRELTRTSPEMIGRSSRLRSAAGATTFEGDPTEADKLILARNPQMSAELLKFSREQMILRNLEKGEDVGQLSLTRLAEVAQTLVQLGVIDAPVAIASVATKDCHRPGGRNRRRLISVCHEP